jgi:capsular polysaccharide biosynthesis protein
MQPINYLKIVVRAWKQIVIVAVLVALLAVLGSFVRPLEYSSTLRLLIIQRSSLGLDPYTAIRSAERVSENLANVIYTTSFFDKVMTAGFSIDQTIFKTDERKKREQWQRMVETHIARGTGLLTITVFHRDREQAEHITTGIGTVLQTEGWTYVGGGDLQVQVVDAPLTSRLPVRPNLVANGFAGLVLGFLAGVGYSVYATYAARRYQSGGGFIHDR